MEITQFTYFQQLGGLDVDLVPAEITYGLERLAMFLQGKRSAFELEWAPGVTWGDVYRENERAVVGLQLRAGAGRDAHAPLRRARGGVPALARAGLPLPAYDQVLKASHTFNLLDARGAISVDRAAAYIGRVRNLAREVAQAYLELEPDADAAA